MNKEIIKGWLNDIATPTGISYSGDQTISESMVENIVDYVDELEQQVRKQQEVIDKTIEYVEKFIQIDEDTIFMRVRQRDYLLEILQGCKNE